TDRAVGIQPGMNEDVTAPDECQSKPAQKTQMTRGQPRSELVTKSVPATVDRLSTRGQSVAGQRLDPAVLHPGRAVHVRRGEEVEHPVFVVPFEEDQGRSRVDALRREIRNHVR